MLTRSDITILMQQFDVTKAYELLAMFKEAGKERIDIRTILDEAVPKIKDYSASWPGWSSSPGITPPAASRNSLSG